MNLNTYSLIKISDIIRMELAPTLSYEDKVIVYRIADSLDMLVMAAKAGKPVSFQVIRDYTQEILPEEDIHDVLGAYRI